MTVVAGISTHDRHWQGWHVSAFRAETVQQKYFLHVHVKF